MSVSHGCEIVHIIQDLVLIIHSKDYVQQIGQFFHFHVFFFGKKLAISYVGIPSGGLEP